MRKSLMILFATCLLAAFASQALAQTPPPPKVLTIFREDVKAARGSAHEIEALLEPYRGHRNRVLRLLLLSGIGPARKAPRMALNAGLGFRSKPRVH